MSTAKKSRGSGRNDESTSGEAVVFNVNKLSRELLIRVFGWLPFHQRHETIPLVCRKWAELTSVPCPLWEHPCIDLQLYVDNHSRGTSIDQQEVIVRWANVLQWFSVRASWVHSIEIRNFSEDFAAQHDCPSGGLASLFGTLWDYLENLYISNCAPVMRPDDLVHLACFSKLVRLNIDSLRGPVEARQLNHLGRLTNLQELRILFAGHGLEQNLLGGFPNHLTALRKLRELELTSVGPGAFISLPESISNWVELRDLQLYRCGFEKVPENISALSKLDTLLMEGFSTPGLGSIELPDHMSRLTSLRRLILSGWCYSSLPRVVGRLSQIQELDFSFNPLPSLPSDFQCWHNLEVLKLNCCELQKLPEAVRSCSKLIQLDVAANDDLDAIPTGAYLANLRDLDLSRCDFHRIPSSLAGAINLERLDMSYNTCMEVDAEGRLLLLNLPALKQINITKDRLHAVGLRGRRSEFKPTPWTDCSMYNLFLLSKELMAHRPSRMIDVRLFDEQEVLSEM
ncbi:hypothetical protein ABBQ38_006209 [Trebouxia sp. C0009 RCD-2024]